VGEGDEGEGEGEERGWDPLALRDLRVRV